MIPFKQLHPLVKFAAAAVPPRTTMPLLKTLRVQCVDAHITITGTNLDDFAEGRVRWQRKPLPPVDVNLDANALRHLTLTDEVEITQEGLTTKGGVHIPHIPGDFPPTAPCRAPFYYVTNLRTALRAVVYAIDPTQRHAALRGVFWGEGSLVTTDGARLARAPIDAAPTHPPVVLSHFAATKWARMLPESRGVQVGATRNWCWLRDVDGEATYQWQTRLIQSFYPDWHHVVPKELPNTYTFERAALLKVVPNPKKPLRLCLAFEGAHLSVSADTTPGEQTIPYIATTSTRKHKLFISARFLTEALCAMESKYVTVHLKGGHHPVVLTPRGSRSPYDDYHIIMPMDARAL